MLSTTIKFTLLAALLKLSSSQTENVAFTLWSRSTAPTSFNTIHVKYDTCFNYGLTPSFMISTISDAEISFFRDSRCTNLVAKKDICGSYGYKTPNGPPEIVAAYGVIITKKDGICKYKRRRREF
ncbi:hypothetical protein AYI69_g3958 [Smittium culicis]|uniref:Uncharacterized protein n=1 Tax=Smittium culicis TaxID=133412 RepID=A0A1R1YIU3_9FUNG|nr:hypothetical protein AYI69_g3958 [Smittium culicis]